MKKLMLFNGKAMACLMLLCLLLAQGCRKEVHLYPATQTDNLNPGPLIKAAKLDAWFATNPVARFLSPNWAKARQAKINDKRIVRVPLFNIDKATAIANATTAIEGKNANYNEKHPPEIIFVEDQEGKLYSFLLNFVPADPSKENGENGIWTGKLCEWNMTGDTIFVQDIVKSRLKETFALKIGQANITSIAPLNNALKENKLQSLKGLKDKQVSSLFGWLDNLIENVAGWIGNLFGVSVYIGLYDANGYFQAYRLDVDWLRWFKGDGSKNSPQATMRLVGVAAGPTIYGNFSIEEEYFPEQSDGNRTNHNSDYYANGGPVYSPYIYGSSNPQPETDIMQDLAYDLNISDATMLRFLYTVAGREIVYETTMYLNANGRTNKNKEFALWALEYVVRDVNLYRQDFTDLLNGVYNENLPIFLPSDFDIYYPPEYFITEIGYDELASALMDEGLTNTDPIPEAYYKNGTKIDMANAPIRNGKTALGIPRNPVYFWKEFVKLSPKMLNQSNRELIADGKSPIVNEQWLKYNPTHKAYLGEQLIHHHEGQGRYAYAIPKKVHLKWNRILHSIRTGKFPKLKGTMNSLAGGMQVFSLLTDFITGNPDAWLNWYGPVDEVGKVYKQPFSGDYFVITKQIKYKNSSGEVIRAKVTYDVYADYIWDEDEKKYMGVLKLGTFTENIDMEKRWATDPVWEPREL